MLLGVFPPPFSRAEALRLLVGVPLPDRESSVRSWREGSLYMATAHRDNTGIVKSVTGIGLASSIHRLVQQVKYILFTCIQ